MCEREEKEERETERRRRRVGERERERERESSIKKNRRDCKRKVLRNTAGARNRALKRNSLKALPPLSAKYKIDHPHLIHGSVYTYDLAIRLRVALLVI